MDVKEDEIVFGDAVKSIIEVIRRTGVRTYLYLEPKIDFAHRSWYPELKSKTIPSRRFWELENELIKLEPVRKCVSLMLERDFPKRLEMKITDEDGKPIENPNYEPFLTAEILWTLANKYIELHGIEFSEEKFRELYDEVVEYVYSPKRELVIISPLENFELKDIEKDEFSAGEYKVRRLTEWEMKALLNFGYRLGLFFKPDGGNIEVFYCVERVIKTSKINTPNPQPYIENFVTLLRLFKAGSVGCNAILSYPKIWRTSYGGSLSANYYRGFPKYTFNRNDIQPFINLLEQFNRIKDQLPNNVKFSLRWFNKSYNEREILDRLLDLAIALEVLFGTKDRLDLYIPAFIGSDREEKLKINEDIIELRDIRGAIVHSGSYKGVSQEFVTNIENYYRRSMHKFLDLLPTSKHETIISNIKASFLG